MEYWSFGSRQSAIGNAIASMTGNDVQALLGQSDKASISRLRQAQADNKFTKLVFYLMVIFDMGNASGDREFHGVGRAYIIG